jgi:hypothetical protein
VADAHTNDVWDILNPYHSVMNKNIDININVSMCASETETLKLIFVFVFFRATDEFVVNKVMLM